MAGNRRINWGADATDARYRTEDTGDGANFVVAEDLDGSTVLLEYDDSATPSEWKVRGPVEMNSNDISGVGTLTASSVNTDEIITGPVTVEDFSAGNLNKWRGSKADYQVQSTTSISGNALEYTGTGNTASLNSSPVAQTPNTPVAGDDFECRIYLESNADEMQLAFGVQEDDPTNNPRRYFAYIDVPDSNFEVRKVGTAGQGSSVIGTASTNLDYSANSLFGEWLNCKVSWGSGGTITVTLDDASGTQQAQVSGSDTAFTDGGHGFIGQSSSSGGSIYFDGYQITSGSNTGDGILVDDFERGFPTALYPYQGGAESFTITESPTYSGHYSLQYETNSGQKEIYHSPHDLFSYYPRRGDTVQCRMRLGGSFNGFLNALNFAVQDEWNDVDRYEISFVGDRIGLYRERFHGTGQTAGHLLESQTGITFSNYYNEWLYVRVKWTEYGQIKVTVEDSNQAEIASFTAKDDVYDVGGIGVRANSSNSIYWDNFEIDRPGVQNL